ncbi:hypothetical protein CCACVL1_13802 [Corchorus capsularis]|uniref:Uncharacterized protein n=1 Tax=Corchorus capsularis TaxID=210143 RepID=A0A1R3I9K5_COCAP|nr:hypothetical protein CCACVL1_13802 [Corchorus capsularis]
MAQRALSQSWISSFPETIPSDHMLHQGAPCTEFSPDNISCTTSNELQQGSFPALDIPSYKSFNSYRPSPFPVSNGDFHTNLMFSPPLDHISGSGHPKCTVDASSMLLNSSPLNLITDVSNKATESIDFGSSGQQQQYSGSFSISLSQDMQGNAGVGDNSHWGNIRSMGFPFSLPPNVSDSWDSPQCPSEMSTTYSTDKCYT